MPKNVVQMERPNVLDEIRFEGRLIAPGGTVDLGFAALIDETGALQLVLDTFPFSLEAYNLKGNGRPGSVSLAVNVKERLAWISK